MKIQNRRVKMAKPKQPVDLVALKGRKHLTKNEVKTRKAQEVNAPSDKINPPDYLPEDLAKKFNKIAKQLIDLDIMSNLDCDALARYIVLEKQFQKVAKKALIMSPINPMYEDMISKQDKLVKQARAAASDLGLTISSRCRLVVPQKDEKPSSKFEAHVK